jgi:opacity protein-like surface antigen
VLLVSTCCAYAQDVDSKNKGWYVGGAVGSASTEVGIGYGAQKERTESYAVYGGYNFTDWFGLEANFFVTGDAASDSSYSSAFGALSFTPKLTLHVTPAVAFFAKAGPSSMAYVEEYKYHDMYGSHSNEQSWAAIVWTYGVGAVFAVTDNLRVRVAYDHYSGDLEDDDDYYSDVDTKLNQSSIGLHYQF